MPRTHNVKQNWNETTTDMNVKIFHIFMCDSFGVLSLPSFVYVLLLVPVYTVFENRYRHTYADRNKLWQIQRWCNSFVSLVLLFVSCTEKWFWRISFVLVYLARSLHYYLSSVRICWFFLCLFSLLISFALFFFWFCLGSFCSVLRLIFVVVVVVSFSFRIHRSNFPPSPVDHFA